ncbi:MAG: TonB-dependent receptor, partial [Bryobacteraceae bacterium]
GSYTFSFVEPGNYVLKTSHPGFKSLVRSGILVRVATDQRLDVQLELGQVADSVEVRAQTPLLESVSSTLGQVVDNKKIVDLPLNGRNALALLSIIPGSSGGGGTGSFATSSNPSINGTRTTGNSFTVDGVSVNQEYTGGNAGSGSVYTPQVDSISEFKVVTSNYSAEYGRAMGGVVTINLKSGTNQFHGQAFEFLRNDKLNARNYFAAPTAAKPTLRYNQFGGAGGGPVIRDKLFFFADVEWTRRRAQATRVSTVPTVRMRGGDFNEDTVAALYDPLSTVQNGTAVTRTPYPNKTMPASAIDPSSKALAAMFPDPNRSTLTANYNINAPVLTNSVRHDTKIDWVATQKDMVTGRFSWADSFSDSGVILPGAANPNATQISTSPTPGFQVNHTHTFSPRLINELRVARQKTTLNQFAEPLALDDWRTKLGLVPIHENRKLQYGFPNIMISGMTALGTPYDVFVYAQRNWNVIDTLSLTAGRHFLRFGGQLTFLNTTDRIPNFPAGGYIFGGQFTSLPGTANTGRPFADFLTSWSQTAYAGMVGDGMKPNTKELGLFIQDDFRLSRKLTLNLGVRYDVTGAPTTAEKQLWTFTPSCNCNRPSEPPFPTELNNFSPRLGFAFQLNKNTVIRSAYGIAYFPQFKGLSGFAVIPPALQQNQYNFADAKTPARTFRDGLGAFVYNLGDINEVAINPTRTTGMFQPNGNNAPYLQSWNLTVEHSPITSLVLAGSYVCNKGTHMWVNRDINTLPSSLLGPDSAFGGRTAQLRRPFPNAGRITSIANEANTNYQS